MGGEEEKEGGGFSRNVEGDWQPVSSSYIRTVTEQSLSCLPLPALFPALEGTKVQLQA